MKAHMPKMNALAQASLILPTPMPMGLLPVEPRGLDDEQAAVAPQAWP